jgi:hypothetical protein
MDLRAVARSLVHGIRAFRCGQLAGENNTQHWAMCDEDTNAILAALQRVRDEALAEAEKVAREQGDNRGGRFVAAQIARLRKGAG